ncbi:MAG TPA: protoporphyrinogen oxidase, partial [Bacteroidales bacterium]|nr:protoporphyrinogen oxidase [Bacteroidales bacterium]
TGLSIAYFLSQRGISCTIFEQHDRCGGVICTIHHEGFTFECGPNTGVLGNVEIEKLFDELQTSCTLETAQKSAKVRLIWKQGAWRALPSGLWSAITTPLFTFFDKLRILGEPFRKAGTNPNETVYELVLRRMGKSFHDYAVAPFINGVYAGNTKTLVTRFALAKLYALEQTYGSFIRGAIAKAKYNKKHGIPTPSKQVFTCKGGLQNLITALEKNSKATIFTQCQNVLVEPFQNEYNVSFTLNGQQENKTFSHVITTCNAPSLPRVLPWLSTYHTQIFESVEYAPVVQVAVGFKKWKGMDIQAFGGLVPPCENRDILGVLFPSSMFSNRAPQGGAMLSVFLGGMLRPDIIHKTDDEITAIVARELQHMLSIPQWNPDLVRIFRYTHASTIYKTHGTSIC